MKKRFPLYQPCDIVLYKHRVTEVDFTPVKIAALLGWDRIGMYWYIVIDERRALTGIREDWLKSAEGLTTKQMSRLSAVMPRAEQLESLIASLPERYGIIREF